MKRYIKSANAEVHISDLFSGIGAIIFVPNVITYNPHSVTASTNIPYDLMDDDELSELTTYEVRSIDPYDINTLGRIYKLSPDKLSAKQKKLLLQEYATKVIVVESDVINILNDLKSCNRTYKSSRSENVNFDADYNFTEQDKLDVVHNLTLGDYVASTKSNNGIYAGNDIVIFEPTVEVVQDDASLKQKVGVYIKLDITETSKTGKVLSYISFHEIHKPIDDKFHNDWHPYGNK